MKRLEWQGHKPVVVDEDCKSVILEFEDSKGETKRIEITPAKGPVGYAGFKINSNGSMLVGPRASNLIVVEVWT